MKVGRNEPCPCGSGKKYKRCHLDSDAADAIELLNATAEVAKQSSEAEPDVEVEVADDPTERAKAGRATLAQRFWVPLLVVTALVITIIIAGQKNLNAPPDGTVDAPPRFAPAADLAPPSAGFSWSVEDGVHEGSRFSEDPADNGGVWSEAHQHWHYPGQGEGGEPIPKPPGPAPAGKIWSEGHGHWHDAQ